MQQVIHNTGMCESGPRPQHCVGGGGGSIEWKTESGAPAKHDPSTVQMLKCI